MTTRSRLAASATLAVLAAACGGSSGGPWRPGGGGPDGASVAVTISLAGDECGVVSAAAFVSGWDMISMGPVALQVTPTAIEGTIDGVPAGLGRQVTVTALDGQGRVVYEGSTSVDVVAGQAATASVVLVRTGVSCTASTGSITVTGTLAGATLAFTDAALSADGVIHFFDAQADRVHRLDLATRTFLADLEGSPTLDAISMAVSPDGGAVYLGYAGGRIDAFDLAAGTRAFFGAAAASVTSLAVAGDHLFVVDASGAWNTHSLYDRATGARTAWVDWRDAARSLAFSPANSRVYYLDSGVSPTDVHMEAIDLATGTFGPDVDSPYHGDYSLPNPLRLLPDESGVLVGSGIIFEAADLAYRTSLGLSFVDAAFLGDRIYLVDQVGDQTQLRVLDSGFDILAAEYFPGQPRRLFAHGAELVLVTQTAAGVDVRYLAP